MKQWLKLTGEIALYVLFILLLVSFVMLVIYPYAITTGIALGGKV